jgi:hypothetical protein
MGNARSRTVKVKPLSGARKEPRPEQSVMETSDLTTHEIWFLKALRSAGAHGRIVSALESRAGLARLVQIGYAQEITQSEHRSLYIITYRGRQALTDVRE